MRDQVVLVTGGTGALGAAVALAALEANRRAMPAAARSGWVTRESVARAVLFLASDAAADVTRTLLAV